jgi:hypothetical protein
MSSNIRALKLSSGEELVVEVVEQTEEFLVVKNVVACMMQRSDKGPILGFIPWMQASEGNLSIKNSFVVISAQVAQEVENGYNQIYGAGIVVPPQQLITG